MATLWTGLIVFALDRAFKLVAERLLEQGQPAAAIPGLLEWRLSYNQGMALGIFSGARWLVLALPVIALGLGWLALRSLPLRRAGRVACGLVIGGFLGNWLDRLLMGHVVDMLYFPWLPWFICNVADVAICAGVAVLAFCLLRGEGRRDGEPNRAA